MWVDQYSAQIFDIARTGDEGIGTVLCCNRSTYMPQKSQSQSPSASLQSSQRAFVDLVSAAIVIKETSPLPLFTSVHKLAPTSKPGSLFEMTCPLTTSESHRSRRGLHHKIRVPLKRKHLNDINASDSDSLLCYQSPPVLKMLRSSQPPALHPLLCVLV